MIEAIYEGARATCRRHPDVKLMPNQSECDDCKKIRRDLGLTPPFDVICHRTHFGVKEGGIYKVVWVIRSGAREHHDEMMGYVLRAEKAGVTDHVYEPEAFTPIQFLEKPPAQEPEKEEDEIYPPGVMIG